jgi:hypothetical protein
MTSYLRKSLVTVCASAALVGGVASTANAQPVEQDGLVNVNVGDITLRDTVDIGVAAQVAAQICGVKVGPVAVLARAVDRSGETRTVCQSDQGPVTISNNN